MIQCHGILLTPCQPEESDENHKVFIERVEDEYYIQIEHDMTKQHYISFVAALSSDKMQMREGHWKRQQRSCLDSIFLEYIIHVNT